VTSRFVNVLRRTGRFIAPMSARASALFGAFMLIVASGLSIADQPPPPRARVLIQTTLTAGLAHHDAKAVWTDLAEGDALDLVRESGNAHDADAVRVEWRGRVLGYLPRGDNSDVARQLDRGQVLAATIRSIAKYRNHRRKLVIDIHAAL
jgi:hypothetical protein